MPTACVRAAGVVALALSVSFLGAGLLLAAPLGQATEEGRALFAQKCASCHTVGGGRSVGPDLEGVAAKRERDWLVRFIVAPDSVLAQKDPIAMGLLAEYNNIAMPNMGVSEAQAAAILAYLEAPGDRPAPTQAAPASAAPQTQPAAPALRGDPALGQALFTGSASFRNGGAACIACHSTAISGALGGGTLGPDLTQAYARFGDAGLASVLSTPPFPTMQPVFGAVPLSPEEQASLHAYLQTTATLQPVNSEWLIAALAGGGFVVLMALINVFWRKRLRGVRRPLVARSRLSSRREVA